MQKELALFEEGKQKVQSMHNDKICDLKEMQSHLSSVAVTIDKFGTPMLASILIDNEGSKSNVLLNVSARFKQDRQIYIAYLYAAKARGSSRESKLRYFYNLLVDKMAEELKNFNTVYIENIDFEQCKLRPSYYRKFGLKYSLFYVQLYTVFYAAIEKVCEQSNKTMVPVQPNRRAHRCMYCGIDITKEDCIDKLVKPLCPYCEQNHSKMSLYMSGCLPYYASVPILLLTDSIKLNIDFDNFKVSYVPNSELYDSIDYESIDAVSEDYEVDEEELCVVDTTLIA